MSDRALFPYAIAGAAGVAAMMLVVGCSTGPMDIDETYYVGASNGTDSVYYRVSVKGQSRLGDAEFRQGWYPANAVDSLFGDISEDGAADALSTREELRRQIDRNLIKAQKKYLEVAVNPESTPDDLRKALTAVLRVRLAASESAGDLQSDAIVMEYSPYEDLITARAGQKLVLLLASDPDQIISQLTRIAEDTRTEQLFTQFAQVVAGKALQEAAATRAEQTVNLAQAGVIVAQLTQVQAALGKEAPMSRDELLGRLDALISILEIDE